MTNATNAAVAAAKKTKTVSHAKLKQAIQPLPGPIEPEFGMMAPGSIIVMEQIRQAFDEDSLHELANDISTRGMLQPLTVRKTDDGYVLVAGERRLRAAMLAKLDSVPVLICSMTADEHQAAQLAENIQRADLTLTEEAAAIQSLHNVLGTVKAVAEKLHKSVPWTSKRLSLSKGLGHYASALMADGITEDIELLQCVDKLDKATPGTNSAWALCQQIRQGKAGREAARTALQIATEPKTRKTEERKTEELNTPLTPTPIMKKSENFRYWINLTHPSHPTGETREVLWKILMKHETEDGFLEGKYNREELEIAKLAKELNELQEQHDNTLKTTIKAITGRYGDMELHKLWMKYGNRESEE